MSDDDDECSVSFSANRCHFSYRDVSALSYALGTQRVIQFLDLTGCTIGERLQTVRRAATVNHRALLIPVNVSASLHLAPPGDEGAKLLARYVADSDVLRHLILPQCGIEDVGGVAIVAALGSRSDCRLQTLDLSHNAVRVHTAEAMAMLLVRHHASPCAVYVHFMAV